MNSSWHPVLSLVQQKTLLSLACQLSELGAAPTHVGQVEHTTASRKARLSRLKRSVPKIVRVWLVMVAATVVGVWNWQLLLATSAGLLSMGLAYRAHAWRWQRLGTRLQQFLRRLNHQLVLVVGTGAVVTFSTYGALAWVDSRSPWIALWALQGLGLVLGLLAWQTHRDQQTNVHFNRMVMDLTHPDPLKRLIAVHQLIQLAQGLHHRNCDRPREPQLSGTIAEYFQLMLRHETETVIQEALLDGLEVVEGAQFKLVGKLPILELKSRAITAARS